MSFSKIPLSGLVAWGGAKSKPAQSPPPDLDLCTVNDGFGIPSVHDPDPFGVLALESAGLEIKEAGTNSRPSSDTFEFKPSPTSPLFRHSFQSLDGTSLRNSRRDSLRSGSIVSVDHRQRTGSITSMDQGTQTPQLRSPTLSAQVDESKTAFRGVSWTNPSWGTPSRRDIRRQPSVMEESMEDLASIEAVRYEHAIKTAKAERINQEAEENEDEADTEDNEGEADTESSSDDEGEAIIEEASSAVQMIAVTLASSTAPRAKVVSISRRAPPALPSRNPLRQRVPAAINAQVAHDHLSVDYRDDASSMYSASPTRSIFDRNAAESPLPWSERTSVPSERTSLPDVESLGHKSENVLPGDMTECHDMLEDRRLVQTEQRENVLPGSADSLCDQASSTDSREQTTPTGPKLTDTSLERQQSSHSPEVSSSVAVIGEDVKPEDVPLPASVDDELESAAQETTIQQAEHHPTQVGKSTEIDSVTKTQDNITTFETTKTLPIQSTTLQQEVATEQEEYRESQEIQLPSLSQALEDLCSSENAAEGNARVAVDSTIIEQTEELTPFHSHLEAIGNMSELQHTISSESAYDNVSVTSDYGDASDEERGSELFYGAPSLDPRKSMQTKSSSKSTTA